MNTLRGLESSNTGLKLFENPLNKAGNPNGIEGSESERKAPSFSMDAPVIIQPDIVANEIKLPKFNNIIIEEFVDETNMVPD